MDQPRDVTFYLDPTFLKSAKAGEHNFFNRVANVLTGAGLRVFYHENSAEARAASAELPGYALYQMDDPNHDRALTMRRSYMYPFWQIERSSRRWEWKVALTQFSDDKVRRNEASKFFKYWQNRRFGAAPEKAEKKGLIYIPLQGLIREHRSFQFCSPIEMVHRALDRFPDLDVVITLHPGEHYDAADFEALKDIIDSNKRARMGTASMEEYLRTCDMVVTQNSSVALFGYFFRKPAVIYAQIDFHHIAGNVPRDGEEAAYAYLRGEEPDYESYIWWFLQTMSINGGRDDAEQKIAKAFRRQGWPV